MMGQGFFEDEIRIISNKTKAVDVDPGRRQKARVVDLTHNALGYQQAVLKVSSYSKSPGRLKSHLSYISRDQDLVLEDADGFELTTKDEVNELLSYWSSDGDDRKNSRLSVNMVLSAPKGSDRVAVKASVRTFAQEVFGGNHDYVFAVHDDTDHPHAHLVVKLRGHDGEKLRLGRQELYDLRQGFAKHLRAHGVQVAATYRGDRGVGRKSSSQKLVHLRQRGKVPRVDRLAAESTKAILSRRKRDHFPWELAIEKRNIKVRSEYVALGQSFMGSSDDHHQKLGDALLRYSKTMPKPKTRLQEIEASIVKKSRSTLDNLENER